MDWLFDDRVFLTRSHCGNWTPSLQWNYIAAHLTIAAAYYLITGCLLYFGWKRRRDINHPAVLWLFACFIGLCGTTHVCDVTVFYWAPYRFYTLILDACAIVSASTALLLPDVVRKALRALTTKQQQDLIDQLMGANFEVASQNKMLKEAVRVLEDEIRRLKAHKSSEAFVQEAEANLTDLSNFLSGRTYTPDPARRG